jgi:hypothetical protein
MANEAKIIYGTSIAHVDAGASISNGAMSALSDVDVTLTQSQTLDYPLANLVLEFTPSASTTQGDTIDVYRRDMDIKSTNDAPIPSTTFRSIYVGSFLTPVTSQIVRLELPGVPLVQACEFYIFNNLTTVSINSGWDLDVIPYTYGT